MPARQLSEDEKKEAHALGAELHGMLEEHMTKEYNPLAMREMKRIRTRLEALGLGVSWKGALNPVTGGFKGELTLFYLVPVNETVH